MGVSTDGIIAYGILLDEDVELPWIEEGEQYGDEEDWWIDTVHGWKPTVEIYADTRSGYVNDTKPTKELMDAYYDEKFAFKKAHPLPAEVVNVCSDKYPMWMIVAPGTLHRAWRGSPETFDPSELTTTRQRKQELMDFCATYGIETNGAEPQWYLASYWG